MGIAELPANAVRAIGASQALVDPCSVVKELIDNALDAHATNISVEISANTLDVIQVRDNGHGVPPADRPLLARPHCTSKIEGIEDLRNIGGSSLGFRGEALASIAELSGALTISTRVDGEQVATSLKFSRQGEVINQGKSSLAVGTVVRVQDYLKFNIVRQQQSRKSADPCLKKIKTMLQAYAFARPAVRFSLQALNSKNSKVNCIFPPSPENQIGQAAINIVGSACASQFDSSTIEQDGFTLHAFLPRESADPVKISSIGSFLSVDGRPMSTSHGTPKQIVKTYRNALKASNQAFAGICEPFICLQIRCPPGSYDANIEPAKDDVLFENPDLVLSAVKKLIKKIYPPHQDPRNEIDELARPAPSRHVANDDRETVQETHGTTSTHDEPQSSSVRQTAQHNMYGEQDDDFEMLMSSQTIDQDTDVGLDEQCTSRNNARVSNPWIAAKMNASMRRLSSSPECRPVIDLERPIYPTPGPPSPVARKQLFDPSQHVPSSRAVTNGKALMSGALPPPIHLTPSSSPVRDNQVTPRFNSHGDARLAMMQSTLPTADYSSQREEHSKSTGSPVKKSQFQRKQGQSQLNKPFVSPLHPGDEGGRVWIANLEHGIRPAGQQKARQSQHQQNTIYRPSFADHGGNYSSARDHGNRQPQRGTADVRSFFTPINRSANDRMSASTATRDPASSEQNIPPLPDVHARNAFNDENSAPSTSGEKGFVPANQIAPSVYHEKDYRQSDLVHTSRRRKSSQRVLRERSTNAEQIEDAVEDDTHVSQPSAIHEAQQQPSKTTGKLKKLSRRKTSRMPLERIPAGLGMQNVNIRCSTTVDQVSRLKDLLHSDMSLPPWSVTNPSSTIYAAFASIDTSRPNGDVTNLAVRVEEMLDKRMEGAKMMRELSEVMRNALESHRKMMDDTTPASMSDDTAVHS